MGKLYELIKAFERELAWETGREENGTEVPWMAEEYRKWMVETDGKKPSVAISYVHYLKAADKFVFMPESETYSEESDFFHQLKRAVEEKQFDEVGPLFDNFLELIQADFEAAEKDGEGGISRKQLSDWRSAFRNYRRFFAEWILPMKEKEASENTPAMSAPQKREVLFAEDKFLEWMQQRGMTLHSAQSYVSRMKTANRKLFSKNKAGVDILSKVSDIFRRGREVKGFDLLLEMEEVLTQKIKSNDDRHLSMAALSDARAAFRKYLLFVNEIIICDLGDDEEEDTRPHAGAAGVATYDYDCLEAKFYFRLTTQNRMSSNQPLFYPISILKRLFRFSGQDDFEWFNRRTNELVDKINVLTDKGEYVLGDIEEMTIRPTEQTVTVTLPEGVTAMVRTETETGESVPMAVPGLSGIHIDHTPLMSKVLADNADKLPALKRVTELIRACAQGHKLPLEPKHFAAIARQLFQDKKAVDEMASLIPLLKEELAFIDGQSSLRLMSAVYNLKKK